MSSTEVWFITGASRGMGADFAKAALAAGHAVVASGREQRPRVESSGRLERAPVRQAGCDDSRGC